MSRYHETRFPYWLIEEWFCWFCWGMSRYKSEWSTPDSLRGSFRSAVRCARLARVGREGTP